MRCYSIKSFLGILAISAFGLNLVWELAQVFAFDSLHAASVQKVVVLCLSASVGDAIITVVAYLIVALLKRKWRWKEKVTASDFFIFAIIGAVSASFIEIVAVSRGIWSYGSYMPIVPIIKIGLLPLLQLTLLLPLALCLTLRSCRR